MSTVQKTEASYRLKFFFMLNKISVKTIGEINKVNSLLEAFLNGKYIHTNGHSSLLEKTVMQFQSMNDNPQKYFVRNLTISEERFREILLCEVQEKINQIKLMKCKIAEKEKEYERYLSKRGICFYEVAGIFKYMDYIIELIEQDLIYSIEDLLFVREDLAGRECLIYIFNSRFEEFKLLLSIGIPCREIVCLDMDTLVKVFNNIRNINELIRKGETFSNIINLFLNEFTIEEIVCLSQKDDDFMEWFVINIDHINGLKRKRCPFEDIIELLEKSIPFLEQRVGFEEILYVFDEYCDVLYTIFDHTTIMIELLKAGMSLIQFALIQHKNLRVSILSNSSEIVQLMKLGVTFSDLLVANITCYNRFLGSRSTMNSVINLAKLGIPCKEIIAQKNHKISRVLIIHCDDLLNGLNPVKLNNGFARVVAYLKNIIDGPFFDEKAFIKVIEDK